MPSGNTALPSSTTVVATEMGQLLLRPPLEPTEDFFLSGGDSLRAVELISRLVERYETDEQTADQLRATLLLTVFDQATPASLAEILDDRLG
jgi:hypothetical protein